MKKFILLPIFAMLFAASFAQTYSWSGYTTGSMSYTTGIMTATVTSASANFQYSTPRYRSGSTVGSGQCGLAGSLAIEQLFQNITSAHVTITIDFTNGNTTNGTCASMQFQIYDINADESVQTFRDVVHISAVDGNNANIPVANITTSGGSNKSITTSGGTTRIIAGSSGSYGSRSQTACDAVTITVTPPAGVPLRRIVIRYQPSYESCPNCYYNWTGPNRPAYQYICIGSLTGTATSGCTVLPIELTHFDVKCENENKTAYWETATETNNEYFLLEGSDDGEIFFPLKRVEGSGTTSSVSAYTATIEKNNLETEYYRLKQVDYDGNFSYSETIRSVCLNEIIFNLYPNPANEMLHITYDKETEIDKLIIYDITGRIAGEYFPDGAQKGIMEISVQNYPAARYQLCIFGKNGERLKSIRFIKI